jgi:phosphoribosyl 1,2-cyclic phosphodiesterase
MPVFVRFWGVRGSIPTPGPRTRRYGGNTSCLEVRSESTICIFDAGTGLRELGSSLIRDPPKGGLNLHLFLSHPHWDHIQGFPFFGPAYRPDTTLWVYGPDGDAKNYQLLSGQMNNAYFPVRFSDLKAKVVRKSFEGDSVTVGDFVVRKFGQKHPGGSVGFRIEHRAGTVVYATDSELDLLLADPQLPVTQPDAMRKLPNSLVKAIQGADLMVADAQYTDEEYLSRVGWGHPRASTVIDLACGAGVRKLALSHHDPMHSDRDTDLKVSQGVERAKLHNSKLEVFGAREGVVLKLADPA